MGEWQHLAPPPDLVLRAQPVLPEYLDWFFLSLWPIAIVAIAWVIIATARK